MVITTAIGKLLFTVALQLCG